jgi:hypothetical protein
MKIKEYENKLKEVLLSKNEERIDAFLKEYTPDIGELKRPLKYLTLSKTVMRCQSLDEKQKEELWEYYHRIAMASMQADLRICPTCKNEEVSQDANFCRICGRKLIE